MWHTYQANLLGFIHFYSDNSASGVRGHVSSQASFPLQREAARCSASFRYQLVCVVQLALKLRKIEVEWKCTLEAK